MRTLRLCFVACLSLFTNNVLLADDYVYSGDELFRCSKVENRHGASFNVEIKRDDWQTIQLKVLMGEEAKGVQCSFSTIDLNRYKVTLVTFEKDHNPNTRKTNMLANEYDGLYRLVRRTNGAELSFEEFDLGSQRWTLNKTVVGRSYEKFLLEHHENAGLGYIVENIKGNIDRDILINSDDVNAKREERDK